MGFGGAFVALADDATAAFANPAGLVQLAEPEISIEGRWWSYSTPYTRSGRASGRPTGLGIDTEPGLRRPTSEADPVLVIPAAGSQQVVSDPKVVAGARPGAPGQVAMEIDLATHKWFED